MAKAKAEAEQAVAPPLGDLFRTSSIEILPRTDLIPWPGLNPRTHFSEAEIEELAESMRTKGWAPNSHLGVKMNPEAPHWIYAGERRIRAAALAGIELIPCVVQNITEEEAFLGAFLENLGREELTPVEEARGIQRYMGIHGELKQADVGKQLAGKGQSWVSNRLRLLKLPPEALALIEDGIVSASAARDDLVPITHLSDEYSGAVFVAIAAAILTEAKGMKVLPLGDQRVGDMVRTQLVKLSGPVSNGQGHVQLPGGSKWGPSYVTQAAHAKECDCGLLSVPRYAGGGGKEPRCFNLAVWSEIQKAGEKRAKARLKDHGKVSHSAAEEQKSEAARIQRERKKIERFPTPQGESVPMKKLPPHIVLARLLPDGSLGIEAESQPYMLEALPIERFHIGSDGVGKSKKLVFLGLPEDLREYEDAADAAIVELLAAKASEAMQEELEAIADKPIGARELATLFALLMYEDENVVEPEDVARVLGDLGLLPAAGFQGRRGYFDPHILLVKGDTTQGELAVKADDDVTQEALNQLLFEHLAKATSAELRLALQILVRRLAPIVGTGDAWKVKRALSADADTARRLVEQEYLEAQLRAVVERLPFLAGMKVATVADVDRNDAEESDDGEGDGGDGDDAGEGEGAGEEDEAADGAEAEPEPAGA